MALAAVLWFLNLYDGLYRLIGRKYSLVYGPLFTLAYILVSVRIVEVVWQFRLG